MSKKFRAEIGGSSWSRGPEIKVDKLSEARAWAEAYGTTADWCNVYRGDRLIARYCRDTNAPGTKWFKTTI